MWRQGRNRKMASKFGKELKMLRLKNDEILKNMADKMEMSSAYLSAIELGKRKVPDDFIEKLTKAYQLNQLQVNEINNALNEHEGKIEIILNNVDPEKKEMAMIFARTFENMGSEKAKQIIEMLKKK
jgi:HTH-type transcriptional regulator, competence development regulator